VSSLEIGQRIEVDLFGLHTRGLPESGATGTVVALGPGVITIRLDGDTPGDSPEVTVSQRRVLGAARSST
jgi:hypothetical protein